MENDMENRIGSYLQKLRLNPFRFQASDDKEILVAPTVPSNTILPLKNL